MRKLTYLSPTSIAKYLESPEDFYMLYLAETKAPRTRQTQPMSIGSAFDAYTKSYLFEKLIGKGDSEWDKFKFDTLFEKQVDPYNRDWARVHGKHAFDAYVRSGGLADIIVELEKAIGKPRFELDIHGYVSNDVLTIPFLGKPDVFFVNKEGCSIIFDWKVNGYCSNYPTSPAKGFIKLFPGQDCHKNAIPINHRGIRINGCCFLEDVDASWARQTTIYGWLCGCSVGSDFVLAIDQVACNTKKSIGVVPDMRFAQHRYRSNPDFQQRTYREAAEIWAIINSGPEGYFRGLPPEESRIRCESLEMRAEGLFRGPTDEEERMFLAVCD